MQRKWRYVLSLAWACVVLVGLAPGEITTVGAVPTTSDRTVDQCLRELPGFPVRLSIGRPVSVVVADLNNDGIPDVALTTFEMPDVESVDFDNGGEVDIPKVRSRLWVLFGEESHHYQLGEPMPLYETYWEGGPALIVDAGDLTGDGFLDLVLGDLSNSSIVIFNYEDGVFRKKVALAVPEPYRLAMHLASADLDTDGKVDIVVAGQYGVLVFWNLGHEAFAPALIADYGDYGAAIRLARGDFNGDGWLDIGVLGLTGTEEGVEHWVDVILNAGDRQFIRADHVRMDEPAAGIYFVLTAGDVDGDGYSDLVTAYNDRVLVLFGSEQGTVTVDRFIFSPARFVPAIVLHDLTGDGCLNIIDLTPEFNLVGISRECYPRIAPRMISGFGIHFPSPHACAVADFGGVPYLIVAGAEEKEGASWSVLSVFVGCRGDGR